jgi:2-dehydro-3-deoxyphosphogluconate aldolase/(4S)-4-hydroxy-2-oxoglutarate aldolase
MDMERFKSLPLMAILRGVTPEQLPLLLEAVIASGWNTLEITMNTPGAADLIRTAVRQAGPRLMIGAGTVLTPEDLRISLEAGASFIVLPTLIPAVVRGCVERRVPVFPGALTPQEIFNAWQAGATMVKLFPAKFFGPEYCKEIKGPFPEIPLLACGGVTPENIGAFAAAGANACAVGASVFRPEWLAAGDYGQIEAKLRLYQEAWPRKTQSR